MSENTSNTPAERGNGARHGDVRALYVENLHYHTNDIAELRRLAEVDPGLAREVLAANRDAMRRMDGSFRLGIVVTASLASLLVVGTVYVIVNIGWWQAVIFTAAVLGISHLLRVILTGEWSDTSWFTRLFGAKSKP